MPVLARFYSKCCVCTLEISDTNAIKWDIMAVLSEQTDFQKARLTSSAKPFLPCTNYKRNFSGFIVSTILTILFTVWHIIYSEKMRPLSFPGGSAVGNSKKSPTCQMLILWLHLFLPSKSLAKRLDY